ncbi:hybrid sensor histidine kinase/response regulator [Christensenella tenuis]|uniref:Stage 0 sporulation protein A homolog n=1 Tax=Christensenella tenuis TaxID=2763033 RepID=A0ABR7EI19_9FIRM|nr:response regulator [Christensenella tenuis]MBC5649417.1 response regulator [Christensenella tenuis]
MEQKIRCLEEANKALKESNEKLYNSMQAFQIAAEESGSLVFTYDTNEQKILVDERTAQAFHVEPVQTGIPYEMVNRGIIARESIKEYIRIHEAMLHGEKEAGGIVKLIPADGNEMIYDLKFRMIMNEDGGPSGMAVGVYRDITERYVKDMAHERYQQIVFSSERYTYEYEEDKDLLSIYPSLAESGGKEVRYTFEHFHERLKKEELCPKGDVMILENMFTSNTARPVQVQLYSAKTGEKRWYAITNSIIKETTKRIVGTIADITDIKQRENSHRKLEHVLQCLKDEYIGIFEVDLENDFYTTLSFEGSEPVPELPAEGCYSETMQWVCRAVAAPDYLNAYIEFTSIGYLKKALYQDRRIEIEYMTNCKKHNWWRTSYQVVEQKNGIPTKAIMYQFDIDQVKTEKLIQQQAMQEAYNYAETANAAKTEFLSRMSHDIRTPLNAIIGMTAIAGTQIENHERVQECLRKITSASKHLLSLINEVLDMSKIEAGKVELQDEEFNLADLIDNMIAMVLPQINEHGHELQVNVVDIKHECVIGDSLRIQQAFVNLIGNAAKYTPDGGKINVRIQEKPMKNPEYGEYEFIFEDNGIGMTEEFQKMIFEPFARAEDSDVQKQTGTGLGMTITRNLIRMMDGDIKVESEYGRGSRFTVTIHLKLLKEQHEYMEELIGLPVLVVDDEQATAESASLVLNEIGMIGEWCLSGQEAVKRICVRHQVQEDYFAVILDWKMPGMDGLMTAKRIREEVGPDIPIIILSAYDWSEIEAEARAAGVDHFISKPLFKSRVIRCFKKILEITDDHLVAKPETISDMHLEDKRALLVEDNEINAEIMSEIIKMSGIRVEWAHNGKEAVEMVGASEEEYYDIIFMDVQMPYLNGYEATAAIRNMDRKDVRKLPIVAMTANAFAEDVDHAKNAGMNEHIAKPVDLGNLSAIMDKYL